MAFLDHIAACNAHDMGKFRRLLIGDARIGWVRHDVARHLSRFPEVFRVAADAVALHPRLATPDQRSQAVDEVALALHQDEGTPRLRGERYRVATGWGEPDLMTVDRGVVSLFGVRAYGIHVNGLVHRPDGLHLWVGRRALDKSVAPGKLDNMVAGGQPAGLTLMENLCKEAAEEADIPAALAATARPVGAIGYCMEDEWGLKPDVMFCYDLDIPPDFTPRNTDGELLDFTLWPITRVAERVRTTADFKFNVNLVILDLLVRHGLLDPDREADYVEIVTGLRRGR
jgi:hypothetical protein